MADYALSLCLLLKNEAHQLPECLQSMANLSPELIVVDTGSSDGTIRLAAEAGAQVIAFDFSTVDFSAARNAGLEQARGRWILVLDADERLDAATLPLLAEVIAGKGGDGYYLERHNFAADSANSTVDYVVRLFRNLPQHRYQGRVHETVDASILGAGGKLHTSGIRLHHRFVSDRESRRRKNHWYIEILKEEIAANPADHSRLDFLAAEYHQLEMFDEATAIVEQLARIRPNDARAHLFAGTYHLLYKPDFKQARADFNRALKLRPGYPEAESFLRLLDSKESGGPAPA